MEMFNLWYVYSFVIMLFYVIEIKHYFLKEISCNTFHL